MNFLFIEKKLRIDKIGMLYISAILKEAGHSVDLIQDEVDNIEDYLHSHKIDYLLMSVTTGEHHWFLNKNRELKSKFSFKTIVGGPHFTFFPEDGVNDESIDFVVQGPGEEVILSIIENKTPKLVKGTLPKSVNDLPFPDRSILYKYDEFGKSGMKRFIAGRDCPNACIYCFNHAYHKIFSDQKHLFFQRINPDRIIEEILSVKEKYGLKLVYFNDDDLVSNEEWIDDFLSQYREKVDLPFCGSVRANNLTEELVKKLSDSKCTFINIALESANVDTQKMLRRGNIKNEQIRSAVLWFKKYNIKVRLQNIIGLPVDNPLQDALETLKFNQEVNPDDSWAAILQPFPKTDMWNLCFEKGLIDKNTECKNFYEDTPLNIRNRAEINSLHKWWYFAVKYKLPIDLIKILITQKLDIEVSQKIQDYRWKLSAKELYEV